MNTSLGFTLNWDYKPTNVVRVVSLGVYTSAKILFLNMKAKIPLKCDVIVGSVVNGLSQPKGFSFYLEKRPGCKVFCETETVYCEKRKKSLLKSM